MAKDPAYLFYPADAAADVSHMNRLERGAYFDIIQAQKKFGPMPLSTIKKVLGKDFDHCWDSLIMCLTYDNDMYYIDWLKNSVEKRQNYSRSRSENRKKVNSLTSKEVKESYVNHMVNENENINENRIVIKKGGSGEKIESVKNSTIWIESISMHKKIPVIQVTGFLEEFLADLKLKDDLHKPEADIKKHFISWLNKKIESKTHNGKQTTNQRQASVAAVSSAARGILHLAQNKLDNRGPDEP